MGISDDIVPRRMRRHDSRSFSNEKKLDIDVIAKAKSRTEEQVKNIEPEEKQDTDSQPEKKQTLSNTDFFRSESMLKEEEAVPVKQPKRHFPKWLLLLLFLILAGVLVYQNFSQIKALFGLKSSDQNESSSDLPTYSGQIEPQDYTAGTEDQTGTESSSSTSESTESTPTATETTIDKKSFTIQVLNGNGVSGSAAAVKNTLVSAGFAVSSLTNAQRFTYQTTVIYYKTGKSAGADLVKAALSARTVATELSDSVAKTYDIVVVVGKK